MQTCKAGSQAKLELDLSLEPKIDIWIPGEENLSRCWPLHHMFVRLPGVCEAMRDTVVTNSLRSHHTATTAPSAPKKKPRTSERQRDCDIPRSVTLTGGKCQLSRHKGSLWSQQTEAQKECRRTWKSWTVTNQEIHDLSHKKQLRATMRTSTRG